MRSQLPLGTDTKLMVIYRLEPDCLGLVGHKQIHEFCHHVTKNILPVDSAFVIWLLIPRLEVSEQEIEYRVNGKLLNQEQVIKSLAVDNQENKQAGIFPKFFNSRKWSDCASVRFNRVICPVYEEILCKN